MLNKNQDNTGTPPVQDTGNVMPAAAPPVGAQPQSMDTQPTNMSGGAAPSDPLAAHRATNPFTQPGSPDSPGAQSGMNTGGDLSGGAAPDPISPAAPLSSAGQAGAPNAAPGTTPLSSPGFTSPAQAGKSQLISQLKPQTPTIGGAPAATPDMGGTAPAAPSMTSSIPNAGNSDSSGNLNPIKPAGSTPLPNDKPASGTPSLSIGTPSLGDFKPGGEEASLEPKTENKATPSLSSLKSSLNAPSASPSGPASDNKPVGDAASKPGEASGADTKPKDLGGDTPSLASLKSSLGSAGKDDTKPLAGLDKSKKDDSSLMGGAPKTPPPAASGEAKPAGPSLGDLKKSSSPSPAGVKAEPAKEENKTDLSKAHMPSLSDLKKAEDKKGGGDLMKDKEANLDKAKPVSPKTDDGVSTLAKPAGLRNKKGVADDQKPEAAKADEKEDKDKSGEPKPLYDDLLKGNKKDGSTGKTDDLPKSFGDDDSDGEDEFSAFSKKLDTDGKKDFDIMKPPLVPSAGKKIGFNGTAKASGLKPLSKDNNKSMKVFQIKEKDKYAEDLGIKHKNPEEQEGILQKIRRMAEDQIEINISMLSEVSSANTLEDLKSKIPGYEDRVRDEMDKLVRNFKRVKAVVGG